MQLSINTLKKKRNLNEMSLSFTENTKKYFTIQRWFLKVQFKILLLSLIKSSHY